MLVATLDELKKQLNIPVSSTADDAELTLYLEATTGYLEGNVALIGSRSIVERVSGGRLIFLSGRPATSVTLVTPVSGTPYSASAYSFDPALGVVTFTGYFAAQLDVVYDAGFATVPADLKLAGLIIASHLWRTQQGGAQSLDPNDESYGMPAGSGFAIPNRARELLRRYGPPDVVPGIA